MVTILHILSPGSKTTIEDEVYGNYVVRYVTLGDTNPASGNRYYVSLSGENADIEWQPGDRIMVELSLTAYKTHGQWHTSHCPDSINFIEINTLKD